jgi:hypothetical protein
MLAMRATNSGNRAESFSAGGESTLHRGQCLRSHGHREFFPLRF